MVFIGDAVARHVHLLTQEVNPKNAKSLNHSAFKNGTQPAYAPVRPIGQQVVKVVKRQPFGHLAPARARRSHGISNPTLCRHFKQHWAPAQTKTRAVPAGGLRITL